MQKIMIIGAMSLDTNTSLLTFTDLHNSGLSIGVCY